jgi:hypothetical protein
MASAVCGGAVRRPGNVLEVVAGTVEVDVPRSVGYFGGLAVAGGVGLIEPPLALFIAAVATKVVKVAPKATTRRARLTWSPTQISRVTGAFEQGP